MDKTLQDLAWSCLPKEFKEEVKKEYRKGYVCETLTMLITLFGHHNLTSDAEGEVMLTVSRNRLMDAFNSAKIIATSKMSSKILAGAADMCIKTFEDVFGSKCLPDNVDSSEPNVDSLPQNPTENCDNKSHISADCNKPAEPKFKVGDKVRYRPSGNVYEVEGKTGRQHYALKGLLKDVLESDLEPYTRSNPNPSNSGELKLQTAEDKSEVNYVNLSQNIKNCDNRLQIAAMAMQGILSNGNAIQYAINNFRLQDGSRNRYQAVAECSLAFADALIAESEKRSGHGK
nr:MAG TPA: hypothetical protein [Caudoviricetes sp.]